MNRQFDLIVFDWDGTLSDSTSLIVRSIQHAFRKVGAPVPDDEQAAYVIGYGLREAMAYLAPEMDEAAISLVVDAYREYYLARADQIYLFDGVVESLPQLKAAGYKLAIATGKARRGLERALNDTGLGKYFDVTRCGDECYSKPHPQMLEQIMALSCIHAERVVMIGDTTHDLNMARNAGTRSLAVSYGAHPRDELLQCEPLALFDRFSDLDQWLRTNGLVYE